MHKNPKQQQQQQQQNPNCLQSAKLFFWGLVRIGRPTNQICCPSLWRGELNPLSQHTGCGASSSFSAWSPHTHQNSNFLEKERKKEHPLEWNSRFPPPTHFAQTYLLSADYSHARLSMSYVFDDKPFPKAFDIVTTNTIIILLQNMGMRCITSILFYTTRRRSLLFVCLFVCLSWCLNTTLNYFASQVPTPALLLNILRTCSQNLWLFLFGH